MKNILLIVLSLITISIVYWGCSKKDTSPPTTDPTVTPVAAFSANKTSATAGSSIVFTDLSTNTPTSWTWVFTGGTPSTSAQQNPTIVYNTAGTYNVMLTAANSAGSNSLTKTAYITITATSGGTLTADFTADNTTVVCYQDVHFTDLSTGSPTSWSWVFTGGTPSTSNQQNPVVKWATQGSYTVKLTVTNNSGSNTKQKDYYIGAAANLLFWKNFSGNNIKVYSCVYPGVPYNAANPNNNLRGTITTFSATAPNCGANSGWVTVSAIGFINYYCLEETTGRHWSITTGFDVPIGTCTQIGLTNTNIDP